MSQPSGLLTRLFLAPAPRCEVVVTIDAVLAPAVAVVGRDRRAVAAGCAIGLTLARRRRCPAAMVCVRGGDVGAGWRSAPGLGARRLAAALGVAGVPAVAAGRLVFVDLDAAGDGASLGLDAAAAVARAEQAIGAAGEAPTVVVLAGPRESPFDRVLAAQDVVGVACGPGDPPVLTGLAIAGLPPGAVSLEGSVSRAALALAASGVAVMPSLAGAVAPLIEALA